MKRWYIYLSILTVQIISCTTIGDPVKIISPVVSVVSIEPQRTLVGQKTTIRLQRNKNFLSVLNQAKVNGHEFELDSIKGDFVYFRMPYISTFTGLYLYILDTELDSTYQVKVDIIPYPEVCNTVCAKWDNIGKEILKNDHRITDWKPTIKGDTIEIVFHEDYPDGYFHRVAKFINKGENTVPEFVELFSTGSALGRRTDSLQRGLVKIVSWNPATEISGTIYGEFWSFSGFWHPSIDFSIDMSAR